MALPATEIFDGDSYLNGVGDYPEWTALGGDNIAANTTTGCWSNNGVSGFSYWANDTFPDDQYCQLVVKAIGAGSDELGPAVRVGAGAANTGYYVGWNNTNFKLYKKIAGTNTELGSYTAPVANDVVRIEASGTTITVKVNGATVGSVTDSSISSGSGGIGAGGSGGTSNTGKLWEAGELSGGAAPAVGIIARVVRRIAG